MVPDGLVFQATSTPRSVAKIRCQIAPVNSRDKHLSNPSMWRRILAILAFHELRIEEDSQRDMLIASDEGLGASF